MNMRSRIVFETDVVNDYFDRLQNKGTFSLIVIKSDRTEEVKNFNLNLQNGVATLSLRHSDTCAVGDILEYEAKVSDDTSIEPFINRFAITVGPIQKIESRKSSRRKSAGDEKGNDRETAGGLALPDINKVYKSEWENRKHKFDEYSALEIVQEEASDKDDQSISTSDYYSFWINMDNIYLKTEMKGSKKEPEITQHQFIYGITLIGMALIKAFSNHEEESSGNTPEGTGGDTETTVEEHVYRTTQAIAPILLPLIETLGALTEDIIKIGSEVSDSE